MNKKVYEAVNWNTPENNYIKLLLSGKNENA